jgi:hypothetical protein
MNNGASGQDRRGARFGHTMCAFPQRARPRVRLERRSGMTRTIGKRANRTAARPESAEGAEKPQERRSGDPVGERFSRSSAAPSPGPVGRIDSARWLSLQRQPRGRIGSPKRRYDRTMGRRRLRGRKREGVAGQSVQGGSSGRIRLSQRAGAGTSDRRFRDRTKRTGGPMMTGWRHPIIVRHGS